VENEYCAYHQGVPVNTHESWPRSNLIPCATALGSGQLLFNPYDSSSDDEEYITPNNVAEKTPGLSDRAPCVLTAAWVYLNLHPEARKNWGQINPNLNDYHSDPMEISSTFWVPDITNWWCKQEATHSEYANLSNVAHDISSIVPHGVGVEASLSLGRDVIGWRQSQTIGEWLHKMVVVGQFARADNRISAGADPELDTMTTENDSEMKKEVEARRLHRMAKVHDSLEMGQGSLTVHATQKESRAHDNQMTVERYISDTEEIVKASCSLFQHDCPAAFKLLERSPLPQPLTAKDLPGGRTHILNVCQIQRINRHPVESDEESAPESNSDTEDRLNWNGDVDIGNYSEDDCGVDVEFDLEQGNRIEDPDYPQQQDSSATPIFPDWSGLHRSQRDRLRSC